MSGRDAVSSAARAVIRAFGRAGFAPPLLASAAFILSAAACDQETAPIPASGFAVSDSAGVPIIENYAPERDSGQFWTVGSEPEFVIGEHGGLAGAANDSSHLLWGVMGTAPLSDGRVVVVSGSNRIVLVFERSGALSAAFGREGEGPGEFAVGPQHLQVLPGDTIVVWDAGFRRVNYFDPSGTLLKERHLDVSAVMDATSTADQWPPETVSQPLSDGSFLVTMYPRDGPTPDHGVVYRRPVHYARMDSTYGVHSFGWWAGSEFLSSPPSVAFFVPYPARSMIAAGGNPLLVYATDGDDYEIRQFSDDGRLQRVLRRTTPSPKPLARSLIREIREVNEALSPAWDWDAWERMVADLPPRYEPAIFSLRVDSAGYLWVADRRSSPGSWSVFSQEGRWLGAMRLPQGAIQWIGRDLLIISTLDPDLGIETIAGYRLNRTQ